MTINKVEACKAAASNLRALLPAAIDSGDRAEYLEVYFSVLAWGVSVLMGHEFVCQLCQAISQQAMHNAPVKGSA